MTKEDIRLARANLPIRAAVQASGKVWFYVPENDLNELVRQYPESYLGILESWRTSLYNQDFYDVKGKNIYVVGSYCDAQGSVKLIQINGVYEPEDNTIRITLASNQEIEKRNWKAIKKDARRITKARLK
jgi:hypothetical protein